jgi:hypothetical protein
MTFEGTLGRVHRTRHLVLFSLVTLYLVWGVWFSSRLLLEGTDRIKNSGP